jgi:uncharacterized protein YegL
MAMTSQTPKVLPVFILADGSDSMGKDGKIQALNKGIRDMLSSFAKPQSSGMISVAIIVFSGETVVTHTPFTLAANIQWTDIPAVGKTPMGGAFKELASQIEDRNVVASRDYRPMVILASDGQPTDDWEGPLELLNQGQRARKADRFALAIGPDADLTVLKRFAAYAKTAGLTGEVFRAGDEHQIRDFFKYSEMSVALRGASNNPNQAVAADSGSLERVN